jgi:hypothetical protein
METRVQITTNAKAVNAKMECVSPINPQYNFPMEAGVRKILIAKAIIAKMEFANPRAIFQKAAIAQTTLSAHPKNV